MSDEEEENLTPEPTPNASADAGSKHAGFAQETPPEDEKHRTYRKTGVGAGLKFGGFSMDDVEDDDDDETEEEEDEVRKMKEGMRERDESKC